MKSCRLVIAMCLTSIVSPAFALPVFRTTAWSDNSYMSWQVATNLPGNDSDGINVDGAYTSFPINGSFAPAVKITEMPLTWGAPGPIRENWISNVASGTNTTAPPQLGFNPLDGSSQFTFFIFKQEFEVKAEDLPGLQLKFQWAADDTGPGPGALPARWSLNSLAEGDLVTDPVGYVLGPITTVSTGFTVGKNVMYFWVQGNGGTDGMSLMNAEFSKTIPPVDPVPAPSSLALLGVALLGAGLASRRSATGR